MRFRAPESQPWSNGLEAHHHKRDIHLSLPCRKLQSDSLLPCIYGFEKRNMPKNAPKSSILLMDVITKTEAFDEYPKTNPRVFASCKP
jgi:hypothetical protein